MNNLDIQVFRSKDIIAIDGSRFFAVFDRHAGIKLKPVLCILSFSIDRRFFQELNLFDFIEFDMDDYFVKGKDYTVITLRPLADYTNQKMEYFFFGIVRIYETIS